MRARFEQFPYFLFNLHSVSLHRKDKISWKKLKKKTGNTQKWPNGDGLSENERKSETKEITKVACPRSLCADKQKFLLHMPEGSRGHVQSDYLKNEKRFFLAKLGHQSRKRAERGWKSEAGPLSWKSGWKPSISQWFWAIGGYCIFFPFRDMAILKCPLGRIKFPMLKYGPVECLIWGMFQWAKQAFIDTVVSAFPMWYIDPIFNRG